ncbi:MAG: hypothetical protein L6Q76_37260 [Polyangiaceae bacterium]|nr:hypothetical protein [Polyangiaceae bacterium]
MKTSMLCLPLALGIAALVGCSGTTAAPVVKTPGVVVAAPDPSIRQAPAPEASDFVSFEARRLL